MPVAIKEENEEGTGRIEKRIISEAISIEIRVEEICKT